MKKIYLPKLLKIEVENFPLYLQQPTFAFDFLNGISAIIGVNGIGKTTFIELIMYSLLGFKKRDPKNKKNTSNDEYENTNYFKDRIKNINEKDAYVFLNFSINNSQIRIGRSLLENKIIILEIDGEKSGLSEEDYQQTMINLTGLMKFESLEKIVRKFLLFDEQRNNIAWEADAQDEILQILFFEEEFSNSFANLEIERTKHDTAGRQTSEGRKAIQKSYDDLIKETNSLNKKIGTNNDFAATNGVDDQLITLHTRKNELEQERLEIKLKIEDIVEKSKRDDLKLNELIGKRDNILLNIEDIDQRISAIETKLYSAIYDNLPDFYVSLERMLCNNGECLVCGSKSQEIKEKAINKSEQSLCLVCSSKLKDDEQIDLLMIDELNALNQEKSKLDIIINNLNKEIKTLESYIEQLNHSIKNLNNQHRSNSYEVMQIDSLISKLSSDKEPDKLTEILNEKQKRINELTKVINEEYQLRDKCQEQLEELHRQFKRTIKQLNSSISVYFNKYASTFLGLQCELTLREKVINKTPHIVFLPMIDGEVRQDIWAVSESQRFFIDQAFRMAIIDYLRTKIDGFETFFITETPEGSLDIAYESKVAEMFIKFSHSNNIIFTSNLNSSRFLFELFQSIPLNERRKKILNLLEKGNITAVQKGKEQMLNELIADILGETSNEN